MSLHHTSTVPRAVTFSEEQMGLVEACLDELGRNTSALNILLTDVTGQVVEFRGRIDKKKAEALAALIAGSHAASTEYIKLLDKKTPLVNLLHEADNYGIYSTNVADALILSIAFGNEVKIGVVRVFVEQAGRRLSEIVHEASLSNADADSVKLRLIDEDFDQLLDKEFDKLTGHKT